MTETERADWCEMPALPVAVAAEHTVQSGCHIGLPEQDTDDIVVFTGYTVGEYLELADAYDEHAGSMWHHRVANVLREAAEEIV